MAGERQFGNYKCTYHLTQQYHFQQYILQIHSHRCKLRYLQDFSSSIDCNRTGLETTQMPIKRGWLIIYSTPIKWNAMELYKTRRKLSLYWQEKLSKVCSVKKKGTKECLVCFLLCKKGAKVRIYVYSYLLIFIETLDEYTSNYKRDYCLGDQREWDRSENFTI